MKSTTKSTLHFIIFIALTLPMLVGYAQIKLNGSYVAAKINYLSGDKLPDDNNL